MNTVVLRLDIVSAEKSIFSGVVMAVNVTGEIGELGIAPGHAPLVTTLKPGNVRVMLPDDKEEVFYLSGGMLEVQPFVVTILADTVLRLQELDEKAALEAKARAEKILATKSSEVDVARATAELAEAIAQIRTIQKLRKRGK
ncbi:MAG: F0F1 ATP synthase subunit epsilon [Gammaproteobacteria bacterium]|nr:F0F1 ATP synthase subunit epsilon [Gammaproteobacteria bacterium]